MVTVKTEVTVQDALNYEAWLDSIADNRSYEDLQVIRRACDYAKHAHEGQMRASGEPYFLHPLAVANILADMRLDYETIAAALLHDVAEDTDRTLADIEAEFGNTIAKLVDGVTKMEYIDQIRDQLPAADEQTKKQKQKQKAKSETFRKMMLAMVEDIRVVLIKLADRIHNSRTLSHVREEKRKRIAKETLDIYAPLANRLGIWQMKWELEDLSFRYLDERMYRYIAGMVDERRTSRERYINQIVSCLDKKLIRHGIKARISGRPKHIYSIWRKMKRKQVDFDQIYDVRAVRVIVNTIAECYTALGIVHESWRPIPGEFDDYIAAPKDNLYRSLHTAVLGPQGKALEVQIRTEEMHQQAEYGIAAHWRYKEDIKSNPIFDEKIAWLRRLMDWTDEVIDAEAFVDNVKTEVFQDRVHVFTPKGDIIDLPTGSTPIDFAYHIHTEVGHRCRGAKVNGRIVSLNYQLKRGDTVSIITTKRGGPSRDWLNTHLGYLQTARARTKVRQWFKHQADSENMAQGRLVLDRELQRLGLARQRHDQLAARFDFTKVEDFLAAIGRGEITPPQIITNLRDFIERPAKKDSPERFEVPITPPRNRSKESNGIRVQGAGDMLTYMAKCCSPVPGDDAIIGYVTRGRGVSIHRADCINVLRYEEGCPERLIQVTWHNENDKVYPVDVEVEAIDRPGLLRDVTTIIANEGISFLKADVRTDQRRHKAMIHATIEVHNIGQLGRVLTLVEQLPNVIRARRPSR